MAGTKQGSMDSPDKDTGMPPNLRKTSGGYQYRRVVPADLREAIGKREIKKNLGSVYSVAKKLHAQLEVETNALFAAARATDGQHSVTSLQEYEQTPAKLRRLQKISASDPSLAERLGSLWLGTLQTDFEARRSGSRDEEECDELEESVRDGLVRLC